MSIAAFIPELWAKSIETARDEACVFAEDCNRQYEGEVRQAGDTVHILGVNRPTIHTVARANAGNDIPSAEAIDGSAIDLTIDQIRVFNFIVSDADRAQAVNGVMDAATHEAGVGMASSIDAYIAELGGSASTRYLDASAVQITTDNVLDKLDAAAQKLYEANVPQGETIVATVSPRFWTILKKKYISLDTSNSEMMKNGRVAKYGNIIIKMSNNVYTTNSGAQDKILVRTQKAIALVEQLSKVEAYRPDAKFADAVKGMELFGAQIVRPEELVVINAKYTA